SEGMSYGVVFLIGLVAAVSSCIAVTGGLLLAVAAKYNEQHPHLSGAQRFRPHLFFNAGRVVSYTVLGGVVGALGSMLTFTPAMTGYLTLGVSVVMIALGLQLLKIFPWAARLQLKPPKFLAHRIHALSDSGHPAGPALLGAGTFFLPCGFTQALQLYVLSQGDWRRGALTMFVFSLGTLPALLSLGVVSSFARGGFQRYFLKFSGAVVLLLGLWNINNGLTLAGFNVQIPGFSGVEKAVATVREEWTDPNVTFNGKEQVVKMDVVSAGYRPARFTIRQNVPVRWEINGINTYGCQSVILMPKLNITKYVQQGKNVLEFTPTTAGELPFHCSMGMYRGSFTVVPNDTAPSDAPRPAPSQPAACDPTISNCLEAQRLQMEISRERGFYPNDFTVRKGVPVELEIDTKVPMGGCMSVMVIPRYKVAHRLTLGKSVVRFTPTESGVIPFTCSMGSKMGQFTVLN
ncbi:MAG: sulfite exporter TauE/SafE family protein, partial [bacterium]|nr:sulfite exporter TauE/SafE family protein [bacterium]